MGHHRQDYFVLSYFVLLSAIALRPFDHNPTGQKRDSAGTNNFWPWVLALLPQAKRRSAPARDQIIVAFVMADHVAGEVIEGLNGEF